MRFISTISLIAMLLLAPACGQEEKPAADQKPAAPGSRGRGEKCVKPDDCQEGMWCLSGKCSVPLDQGMRQKRKMEQVQDEHYEQLDDKVKSIEEQMRE